MLYKAFVATTLIAAPLIVMTIQNFLPEPDAAAAPSANVSMNADRTVASPAPAYAAPPQPVVEAAPVAPLDPASFSQPLPGAAQPTLVPGQPLGAAPATVAPPPPATMAPPAYAPPPRPALPTPAPAPSTSEPLSF